jgi:transcriptional regulator with XRE-family HTH domain
MPPQDEGDRTEGASREFLEAVGRTIKVLRTDLDISRRDLAEQVGISYSYLTEIENGNKPASSTILRPLAHALGMRLSQLTELAERRLQSRVDALPELSLDAHYDLNLLPKLPQLERLRLSEDEPLGSSTFPASPAPQADQPQQVTLGLRPSSTPHSAMRPSLRGQYRELREAILELERLLQRMAPDDIERLLDYARRLSR